MVLVAAGGRVAVVEGPVGLGAAEVPEAPGAVEAVEAAAEVTGRDTETVPAGGAAEVGPVGSVMLTQQSPLVIETQMGWPWSRLRQSLRSLLFHSNMLSKVVPCLVAKATQVSLRTNQLKKCISLINENVVPIRPRVFKLQAASYRRR